MNQGAESRFCQGTSRGPEDRRSGYTAGVGMVSKRAWGRCTAAINSRGELSWDNGTEWGYSNSTSQRDGLGIRSYHDTGEFKMF